MKTITIGIAALALAGCTTAQVDQGKAIARASIDTVCSTYLAPHAAFQALAATGRLKPDLVEKERLAVVALEQICADPPKDAKTAIASASRVFSALLNAAAEARKQTGG